MEHVLLKGFLRKLLCDTTTRTISKSKPRLKTSFNIFHPCNIKDETEPLNVFNISPFSKIENLKLSYFLAHCSNYTSLMVGDEPSL